MKKKILAAFVCAATVLSLAGCASDAEKNALANIASNAANQTSKPTSSATTSKANTTSSAATNSTTTSKPATSSTGTTSSAVSSTASNTSKPKDNLADWTYSTYDENGKSVIQISKYKGADEKVEVPSEINGLKVTKIKSGAFQNNIDITSITIPESVTYIGSSAFSQCLNLSEITFKGSTPTLESSYYDDPLAVFEGTPWLEAKKAENPNFFIIGDVLYKDLGCEGDITIPNGVKKIADFAFTQNKKITSVAIPDGVTEIGAYAFGECAGLVSVTIPDSVTTIGYEAFYYCLNLKSANIPQNLVYIGEWAFGYCDSFVGSFTLPDSIRTFYSNSFNYNKIELTYKGTAYKGINGYKELITIIQETAIAEEFGDNDFVITDNVLMKIKPGVTKIELPDTVKGIDANAFDGCNQSIIITFKGKNYNLANLDKLKADISAN